MVTTDACSEGIDVPECNLVISMDKLQTSRALIHTRGRARSRGGRFIIMIEVTYCAFLQSTFVRYIASGSYVILSRRVFKEALAEDPG